MDLIFGLVLGFFAGAFGAICWALRHESADLPCPHPHCRNRLPRRGTVNLSGQYVTERCGVCEGLVLFNPEYKTKNVLDHNDHYLRVHEANP